MWLIHVLIVSKEGNIGLDFLPLNNQKIILLKLLISFTLAFKILDFIQNHDSQTCLNPESAPHYNNQTCEPRPLSLMEQTWNKLLKNTVAITAWTWNGINRASKTTVDFVATMPCKFCGGVKFTAEWIFDKVPFMAEWTWQQILCMARWTWDNATDLAEWTWCQLTHLANRIWDTISWIINFCFTLICEFIDTASELYAVYLKSK